MKQGRWMIMMITSLLFVGCSQITEVGLPEVPTQVETSLQSHTIVDIATQEDKRTVGDGLIPWSSERKIEGSELFDLAIYNDIEQLELAKEEIYIRAGQGQKDVDRLSDVEKYNIKLLDFLVELATNEEDGYLATGTYPSNYTAYDANKEILEDLDGDGKKEVITYQHSQKREDGAYYTVQINDIIYEIDYKCDPLEQFAIVDINTQDNYKEIIISDNGSSNDYVSYIYCYRDGKLEEVGTVEGLFNAGVGIDGKGNVTSRTRGDLLQSWYIDIPYKLAGGQLHVNGKTFTTNHKVFTKVGLPVYESNTIESKTFVIPEGQVATLTGTDNKIWCRIETEDEKVGWFQVIEYDEVGIGGLKGYDVFEGLTYFD